MRDFTSKKETAIIESLWTAMTAAHIWPSKGTSLPSCPRHQSLIRWRKPRNSSNRGHWVTQSRLSQVGVIIVRQPGGAHDGTLGARSQCLLAVNGNRNRP